MTRDISGFSHFLECQAVMESRDVDLSRATAVFSVMACLHQAFDRKRIEMSKPWGGNLRQTRVDNLRIDGPLDKFDAHPGEMKENQRIGFKVPQVCERSPRPGCAAVSAGRAVTYQL